MSDYTKAFGAGGGVPATTHEKNKSALNNPLYTEFKEWCINNQGGTYALDNTPTLIINNIYEGRRFAQNETKYAIWDDTILDIDPIKEASFIYAYTKGTQTPNRDVTNNDRQYNAQMEARSYLLTLNLVKA